MKEGDVDDPMRGGGEEVEGDMAEERKSDGVTNFGDTPANYKVLCLRAHCISINDRLTMLCAYVHIIDEVYIEQCIH